MKHNMKIEARIMKSGSIEAVHDDDIITLLGSLGVLEKYNSRKCKCHFCENIIEINNFSAVFPFNNDIAFCCDNLECIAKLMKETR